MLKSAVAASNMEYRYQNCSSSFIKPKKCVTSALIKDLTADTLTRRATQLTCITCQKNLIFYIQLITPKEFLGEKN